MFDLLVQATMSNLLVSTLLAGLAWIAQRRLRSASLVNLLWVIVLVKLVTPPVFSIPAIEISRIASVSIEPVRGSEVGSEDVAMPAAGKGGDAGALRLGSTQAGASSVSISSLRSDWVNGALYAWVSVSGLLFLVSTVRILRFNRLLKANGRPAPKSVSEIANDLARRFGLRRVPRIFLSRARITPFVWWLGGQPRITISEQAAHALCRHDLRLVIAHEIAHIKRRDHWVRWLEWFAVNLVWWNPVMWWARSQLRISEEIACDGLVIESIESERPRYAHALLNMADLMTSPAVRPPAVVSAISSGGDLERRLMMIIAEKTWHAPAALRLAIAVSAICILPLGLVYAQDMEAVERRLGSAVGGGELTLDQAKLMMDALMKSASGGGKTGRARDGAAPKNKHAAIERKLKIAVESGLMSADEAKQALAALEQNLSFEFDAIEPKINAPVGDGKLSPLEAMKQLGAIHEKIFGPTNYFYMAKKDRDRAALKTDFEAIERKIKAAVDDGKLSAPEAKHQLGAIHEKMFGPTTFFYMADTERDRAALKTDFEAIERKIKAAVDQGKLSDAEAKRMLGAIRQKLLGPSDEKAKGGAK